MTGFQERTAVLTTITIVAGIAAVLGFEPMRHLFVLAGEGNASWVEVAAMDGLLAGNVGVLFVSKPGPWSAWLVTFASIAAHLAAIVHTAYPWAVWLVGAWPSVAVSLGCITIIRAARQHEPTTHPTRETTR